MQLQQMLQKTPPRKVENAREVPMQDLPDRNLIMTMRLRQPRQIPLKARLALPFLNLALHDRHVGAELE